MGRRFTLRGNVTVADGAISPQIELLDYLSPDRTRAWKIRGVWVWPRDTFVEIGGTDENGIFVGNLTTDVTNYTQFNDICNAGDNRQCAWAQKQYLVRHSAAGDFIVSNSMSIPAGSDFLIQEDKIIVKELYLQFFFRKEGTVNNDRTWNYLVELEEVSVTPWQSLFQQLKGIGQAIDV